MIFPILLDRVDIMTMKNALAEGAHTALMLGAGGDECAVDKTEERHPWSGESPSGATSLPAERKRSAFEGLDGRLSTIRRQAAQ